MLKKKKRTPSRIRYEQNHPTVSFRVSKELYDRLEIVKEAEGKSITDVLRVGVGLFEVKNRKEKEVRDQAYDEGYEKGYEEAEELYKVTCPCKICHKMITVTDKNVKEAIRRYMLQHGWVHTSCSNRGY